MGQFSVIISASPGSILGATQHDAQKRTGEPLVAMLRNINDRIEFLIDREHRIGHALFMTCETRADVHAVMRNKVIPLLQEYFFEDWSRLAAVLGDGGDKNGSGQGTFLAWRALADPFGHGEMRISWSVRPEFATDACARLAAMTNADALDESAE